MNLLKRWKTFSHNMSRPGMLEDYLLTSDSYDKGVKGKGINLIILFTFIGFNLFLLWLSCGKFLSLPYVEPVIQEMHRIPIQFFLCLCGLGGVLTPYSLFILSKEETSPSERQNGRISLGSGVLLMVTGFF